MAGGKNKIHEHEKANTNGFSKNPQNIGKGRKKKIYTILKEKGFSKDDITSAFGELVWYSVPELKKLHKDETKPSIIRIVANQIYHALKNADYNKIKEIMEHVIGKPKQDIETNQKHSFKQITGMIVK